ncbi:lipopolysaccharide/colanic/teichoic acid biosynthesis glycosyltransferase [Sphingomonas insulae]|uniref:Bacterial sugar transferase domain-containing protein n=1 Tax=Sphingomonas insulae TaxID=424800 RepID=A0ABP3T2U5_9SPHN|nr:sugar transferase [Sphingomonas insulae]NIJ31524.1 lipopolysaccharide/colanic/teichoic acid biosynthesis glycosyltransferase [Sphingomonas insulae]
MLDNVDPPVAQDRALHQVSDRASDIKTHWRPRSALLQFRAVLYLLSTDLAAIFGGFLCTAILRQSMVIDTGWLVFALVLLPVYALFASNIDAYDAVNFQDPFRAIRRGLQALALAIGSVILVVFYLKSSTAFPRLTIALGSTLAALFLVVARYGFVRHLNWVVGGNPFSSILLCDRGAPIPPGKFSMIMAAESYFDPDEHDPHMYDRLATLIASADRVVVTCAPEHRMAWAKALRGANVQSEIVVPELAALAPLGLGPNRDVPSIIVAAGPLSLTDRIVKRLFDIAVASTALLCLLPLLIITAIAVRLNSAGPILFKQVRIGRGNQMFSMFKFRSMYVQQLDGAGHRSASRNDDRITGVGRIIRKTSLDELPQLVNVLKGDMSIVGPRPHALGSRAADKLFWEVDQRYWDRHATKPGLTGLAQVRGFRGATLIEDDLKNRLQADLEYLENWSIWRDLKIIFLTVRVILHRNAF